VASNSRRKRIEHVERNLSGHAHYGDAAAGMPPQRERNPLGGGRFGAAPVWHAAFPVRVPFPSARLPSYNAYMPSPAWPSCVRAGVIDWFVCNVGDSRVDPVIGCTSDSRETDFRICGALIQVKLVTYATKQQHTTVLSGFSEVLKTLVSLIRVVFFVFRNYKLIFLKTH
jgi:hypothetical protein